MSKTTTWAAVAALGLTVTALTGCASEAETGDEDASLKIALVPTAGSAPVIIADEQGFFEEEGLDVQIEEVPGPAAVAALQSGEVEFASLGASVAATAVTQGVPLTVISGRTRTPESEERDETAILTMPDSGIETVSDLSGVTVGTQTLTSQATLMARNAIDALGGNAADVEFIDIAFPDQMSALRSGSIDAAAAAEPFVSQMEQEGATRLLGVGHNAFDMSVPIGVIITSTDFASDRSESVEAFQRAHEAAVDWANEDEQRLREALPELIDLPPEQVESMILPTFDAAVTEAGMATLVDAMVEQGFIEEAPDLGQLVP